MTWQALRSGLSPRVLVTLGIGAAGGFAAFWLRLPLAWMIGAMVATTLACLAGVELAVPARLRGIMVTVLGVLLGSAFSPSIFSRLDEWAVSLSLLLPYIFVVALALWWLLRKGARYDNATAYFAAVPGGLNEMMMIGSAMGGDERTLALAHAVRVLFTVMAIPMWFRFTAGYVSGSSATYVGWPELLDCAILVACMVVGGYLGRLLRLPAAALVGPMALSAAVHLAGLTSSAPPTVIVSAAQLVIGCGIGQRFSGAAASKILNALGIGLITTLAMLAITVLTAWGLHHATGLPTEVLVLAFAPGGLAEMSLVALYLHADAPFVATHHIVRIIIVILLAPGVYRLLLRTPWARG